MTLLNSSRCYQILEINDSKLGFNNVFFIFIKKFSKASLPQLSYLF